MSSCTSMDSCRRRRAAHGARSANLVDRASRSSSSAAAVSCRWDWSTRAARTSMHWRWSSPVSTSSQGPSASACGRDRPTGATAVWCSGRGSRRPAQPHVGAAVDQGLESEHLRRSASSSRRPATGRCTSGAIEPHPRSLGGLPPGSRSLACDARPESLTMPTCSERLAGERRGPRLEPVEHELPLSGSITAVSTSDAFDPGALLLSTAGSGGPAALQDLHHRRGDVGVVMDELPPAGLAPVDVGDPLLDGDRLAGHPGGATLDPDLVAMSSPAWMVWSAISTWASVMAPAACSKDSRTACQPTCSPPMGCMVVTESPCDQSSGSCLMSMLLSAV